MNTNMPYSYCNHSLHFIFSKCRQSIPVILLILLFRPGWGQPITIQTESAPVEYFRMPDEPLDPSYATYNAEIDIPFSELSKTGLTEMSLIDQYLRLEGYKRIHARGDIEIKASVGDFTNWGEFRKTSRHKTKEKDGKERTVVKHYLELKYSLPVSVLVRDKENRRLLDKYIFSLSDTRTWNTPSYNSASELDSYWRRERNNRINALHKERIVEAFKTISDLINSRFGYQRVREHTRFETIGKKKHPAYETFHQQVNLIKAAFKKMDADQGLEEIQKEVTPVLTFYQASNPPGKSGNKDQEKLQHICLYNQANLYFWLEEFEKAEKFAKELQTAFPKDKAATRLLKDIEYVKSSLHRANRTSRHGKGKG